MNKRTATADQPVASAPAAPAVVWPTAEARDTVVGANQSAWQRHAESARDHRECAKRLDFEIGTKSRDVETKSKEIEQLRRDIEFRVQEMPKQDHYASQEQAAADAYAVALAALGEQVPPLPERPVAAGMSALEVQVHQATWSGMDPNPTGVQPYPSDAPQAGAQTHPAAFTDSFSKHAERPADGYCINCGEPVWREPIDPETAPKGAKHGFGATCTNDPRNVADLGDQSEVGR